jgi:transcriptional regulator with XRE-family HTH domain
MEQDSTSPRGDFSGTLRTLGLLLKSERVKRGLNRDQLAEKAGVTKRMVGKVERGETEALMEAWHMAIALGRDFSELVAEAEREAS